MIAILSIVLFCFLPFVSIPILFLGIALDKKHTLLYSILLALIFAIISYNFLPDEVHDLYRYFYEMKYYYSHLDFPRYLEVMFSSTKIIFSFLQFIFSQIGNFHLLPFSITLIGYTLSFYMMIDFVKSKKYPSSVAFIILLMFILSFYHINFISGLAQYLAIVVGFFAFYLEYIKGKKQLRYKIFYILPIFIHISMIIIPLIRFLLNFDYKRYKYKYYVVLTIYAFCPIILYKILSLIPSLSSIALKIDSYMLKGSHTLYTSYDLFTLLALIIYGILFFFSYNRLKNEYSNKILDFTKIVLLFNLCSLFYRDIFSRVFNLSLLCMCLYFSVYLSKMKMQRNVFVLLLLIFVSLAFASVSFNIFKTYDFNNIFRHLFENLMYYFRM